LLSLLFSPQSDALHHNCAYFYVTFTTHVITVSLCVSVPRQCSSLLTEYLTVTKVDCVNESYSLKKDFLMAMSLVYIFSIFYQNFRMYSSYFYLLWCYWGLNSGPELCPEPLKKLLKNTASSQSTFHSKREKKPNLR
jgi:hypothetical protein